MAVFYTGIFVSLFCTSFSAPQQPEINDQFKVSDLVTADPPTSQSTPEPAPSEQPIQQEAEIIKPVEEIVAVAEFKANGPPKQEVLPEDGFSIRVYRFFYEPIIKVVRAPKVNAVLRNIGTCVVNGAMELFSYYLPAPLMPLLASAAGLVIPFEPVVMLKEKMPVTSYRRAFQTAMSSFMRTFDKYKVDDDYDPYMTRRFNRRFLNDNQGKVIKTEK